MNSFRYRSGIHIEGTVISCDATASAGDLIFLSHAQALGTPRGSRRRVRRTGQQQLLATETTLALLGRAGDLLRPHALPAAFGRPFSLGGLRLELFPSGHLPGSASLLCEMGKTRIVYAGTVHSGAAGPGTPQAEVRHADVLCVEGTFGSPRFVFPPREEALAQIGRFAKDAIAHKQGPVLLVSPFGPALEVAAFLLRQGLGVRVHRAVAQAARAFAAIGATVPATLNFTGRLGSHDVLLWPPTLRGHAALDTLAHPAFAFVSGLSLDRETMAGMRAEKAIALSNQAGFPELLAYIEATGAREIAVHRGFPGEFAEALVRHGLRAYALGPARQLDLFRG